MTDKDYNKDRFITLLKTTNRAGIDKIITWLESTDFLLRETFHLCININSIIIMSLLHDVCKANCYTKEKKNVKIGQNWTQVDYWKFDDTNPIGHGHKSVILLQQHGLTLNDLEIQSIITHMNGYDKSDLFNASNVYNNNDLTIWLHVADFIATYKDRKVI